MPSAIAGGCGAGRLGPAADRDVPHGLVRRNSDAPASELDEHVGSAEFPGALQDAADAFAPAGCESRLQVGLGV